MVNPELTDWPTMHTHGDVRPSVCATSKHLSLDTSIRITWQVKLMLQIAFSACMAT